MVLGCAMSNTGGVVPRTKSGTYALVPAELVARRRAVAALGARDGLWSRTAALAAWEPAATVVPWEIDEHGWPFYVQGLDEAIRGSILPRCKLVYYQK